MLRHGERQNFAAAHAGEQAGDRPGIHGAAAQLVDQLADPLLRHHLDFFFVDLRRALERGDVLGDQAVAHGVAQRVRENAVRVADGPGAERGPERAVPPLDIERA